MPDFKKMLSHCNDFCCDAMILVILLCVLEGTRAGTGEHLQVRMQGDARAQASKQWNQSLLNLDG
jgi:hypothetical protein